MRDIVRVLKLFAVHYGLLVASASTLTQGKRAPVTRKSLCTFAEQFLMHAHKSLRKMLIYISVLTRFFAFAQS